VRLWRVGDHGVQEVGAAGVAPWPVQEVATGTGHALALPDGGAWLEPVPGDQLDGLLDEGHVDRHGQAQLRLEPLDGGPVRTDGGSELRQHRTA
jgi:hypothetical protein